MSFKELFYYYTTYYELIKLINQLLNKLNGGKKFTCYDGIFVLQ